MNKIISFLIVTVILICSVAFPSFAVNGGYVLDHPDHVQNWDKTPDDIDWLNAPLALKVVLDKQQWSFNSSNLDIDSDDKQFPFINVIVTSNSNAFIYFGFNCSFGDITKNTTTSSSSGSTTVQEYFGLGFVSSVDNYLVSSLSSIRYNFDTNTFHSYTEYAFENSYTFTLNNVSHGPYYFSRVYTNSSTQKNYKRDFYLYGSNISTENDINLLRLNGSVTLGKSLFNATSSVKYYCWYRPNVYGLSTYFGNGTYYNDYPNYYFSFFVPNLDSSSALLDPDNYSTTSGTTNGIVSDYASEEQQHFDNFDDGVNGFNSPTTNSDGLTDPFNKDFLNSTDNHFGHTFLWIRQLIEGFVGYGSDDVSHGKIYFFVIFILMLGIVSFILGVARRKK